MREFLTILGDVLRFAQSSETLRGRAAYCYGRARRLIRKAEHLEQNAQHAPNRRRGRMLKRAAFIRRRITWWTDRAELLDRRAANCERG
jgi:hypothetical protein